MLRVQNKKDTDIVLAALVHSSSTVVRALKIYHAVMTSTSKLHEKLCQPVVTLSRGMNVALIRMSYRAWSPVFAPQLANDVWILGLQSESALLNLLIPLQIADHMHAYRCLPPTLRNTTSTTISRWDTPLPGFDSSTHVRICAYVVGHLNSS